MKKTMLFAGILLLVAVSCQKEKEQTNSESSPKQYTISLSASGEPATKADLSGEQILWAEGDQIKVRVYKGMTYDGKNDYTQYTAKDVVFNLTDGEGTSQGTFTSSESLDEYVQWGYGAFYPVFDSNISNDHKVYFHLKSYYENYRSGSLLMPMVANMNDEATGGLAGRPTDIHFKHVGAGIKITLKDIPATASQVSLTIDGKNINGWYNVLPENAGKAAGILTANDGTYSASRNTTYLQFATAEAKRDMTFIFPIPTLGDTFDAATIKLYTGANSSYTEFWSVTADTKSVPELTRGQVLDLGEKTVPIEPSEKDDKIWIDGKTKDWSDINTKFSTSDDSILEWKYTSDSNNLYLLYKLDASKITTDSENFDYSPYIYIGFDTDNDPAEGKNPGGGLGAGYEAKAVIFPWRGPSSGTPQCVIGEDENGHIDRPADTSSEVRPKLGGKIKDSYCYVEVKIPFSTIGITSSTSYITMNHAMHWSPVGRQMISIAGGPLPAIITATDKTVGVGQTESIGATTTSSGTITYTSNNTAIATVSDSGVITGVSEGSTTITLNVAAVGTDYAAGTKTINVTVTPAYTPAIDIDGDMTDWKSISTACSYGADTYLHYWKFKSDSRMIYFYFALRKNRVEKEKNIYIGFNLDNKSDTGSNYGNVPGCEAYVKINPFTNTSESTPEGVEGLDANSIVYDSKLGTHNGSVYIWSYDAGESTDSNSSSIYVEVSIDRTQISLPAAGNSIKVGCSYGWSPSSPIETTSVTLE